MPNKLNIFQWIEDFLRSFRYESATLIRTVRAFGLVVAVFLVGTFGFWFLSDRDYGLLRCAFMTVVTLTTVGYGEVVPVTQDAYMQAFTILLIVLGMGGVLYFASSFTAFIVDGELRNLIRHRSMRKTIENLDDHYIVAGIGETGAYILDEILQSRRNCIVIDTDRERIDEVLKARDYDFPFLVGDATEDHILEQAGVRRASGLICSLGTDRDNLFVTISARSLNSEIRIVTRGYHPESEQKFKMAGATSVIFTNVLSGMWMAAKALRPSVTTFLDLMMQHDGETRRVEEFEIPTRSPLCGGTIADTTIRQRTDALIIAVWDPDEEEYVFNPAASYEIDAGSKLIVLTLIDDIEIIENIISGVW